MYSGDTSPTAALPDFNHTPSDRLLSEKEVAGILALQASTLRTWRCQGKGPKYVKLGERAVRYKHSSIQAFIGDLEDAGAAA